MRLPSQGVWGEGDDKDGYLHTLPAPARAGNRDHCGGWKPIPSTVSLLQNYDSVGGINGLHPNTTQCKKVAERKRHRLAVEDLPDITEKALRAYCFPLTLVPYFKYLGRIITSSDYEWPAVGRKK